LPLLDCTEFGNFVITLIFKLFLLIKHDIIYNSTFRFVLDFDILHLLPK
jgi:hypothetical protein